MQVFYGINVLFLDLFDFIIIFHLSLGFLPNGVEVLCCSTVELNLVLRKRLDKQIIKGIVLDQFE